MLGPDTFQLLSDLVSPDPVAFKISLASDLLALLNVHFFPKKLVIAERFRFNSRSQREGESIAVYVTDLRNLAKDCRFGASLQEALAMWW